MQAHTPSQQIASLQARLSSAYIERDNLDKQRARVSEEIDAIRNLLAGAQLGQQAAAEKQAETNPKE